MHRPQSLRASGSFRTGSACGSMTSRAGPQAPLTTTLSAFMLKRAGSVSDGRSVADASGSFREAPGMRTLVSALAFLVFVAMSAAADDPPAKKDDSSLKAGNNLPGTFHPYNVTGPYKQHFHCPVSEHGLEPMVLIFHKNVDFSDPLPDFLKRIDTAIEKNPDKRLGAFVTFVSDDLPDVSGSKDDKDQDTNSKNDDARLELEKKIEQGGADMKLRQVVLGLDSKSDVTKYQLSDENLVTVVLYTKLKIVAVHALSKSDFTNAAVDKIMADVGNKLGAKRK
jgi:hypothetical protein